jgi:hypothetical protein
VTFRSLGNQLRRNHVSLTVRGGVTGPSLICNTLRLNWGYLSVEQTPHAVAVPEIRPFPSPGKSSAQPGISTDLAIR